MFDIESFMTPSNDSSVSTFSAGANAPVLMSIMGSRLAVSFEDAPQPARARINISVNRNAVTFFMGFRTSLFF